MEKKKREDLELKIYSALGVKQFRNLAFKLEKLIHIKDKKKNINYHINDCKDLVSVDKFKKYLYYNGFIHVKNLIFGSVGLALMIILNASIVPVIALSTLLLKDAYCVMLQRYNWIRITRHEEKLKARERKRIDKVKASIDKEKVEEVITNNKVNREELIREIQALRNYLNSCNKGVEEVGSSLDSIQEMLIKSMKKAEYTEIPRHFDLGESENQESEMKLTFTKKDKKDEE